MEPSSFKPSISSTVNNPSLAQVIPLSDPNILFEILKFTNNPGTTELVCHNWKNCTRISQIEKYTMENSDSPIFARLSPWIPRPDWLKDNGYPLLSCTNNLITFQPENFYWRIQPNQSDLFPFLPHNPFNGKCHLLGASEGVYVFQSLEKLEELTVAKDLKKPEEWQMIRLDTKIGPKRQKKYSFVVSAEKVVLLSYFSRTDCKAISLCLRTGKELFSREFKGCGYFHGEVNGYLFFDNHIIHLKSDDLTEIFYNGYIDFEGTNIVSCGNSFYLQKEQAIYFLSIDSEGQLQFKWGAEETFKVGKIPVRLQQDMVCNDRHLVVKGFADFRALSPEEKSFNTFHIVDTQGNPEGVICLFHPNNDPYHLAQMHLIDDLLIYIDPADNKLVFWHIPSKKCINKFGLGDFIVDIHSTDDKKLIVLTSRQGEVGEEYRTILFDLSKFLY